MMELGSSSSKETLMYMAIRGFKEDLLEEAIQALQFFYIQIKFMFTKCGQCDTLYVFPCKTILGVVYTNTSLTKKTLRRTKNILAYTEIEFHY